MQNEFRLEELKQQAIALIKVAGFNVRSDVKVVLDEKLPFMGYTTEENDTPTIVVAGFALKSGGTLNLLIHELSHVYRRQTNHPSHDYQLLTTITGWVIQDKLLNSSQEQILQGILNHLQDLYADDISFAVFNANPANPNLNEFFMTWMHPPSKATDPEQKAWENAAALLNTSFAQANLERHKVPDSDNKVADAVKDFLSKMDKSFADKYSFFETFMVNLPEEVTKKEFENLLIKYLSEFLKLTKN
ncbi:MAG: DUF5781 family protein [Candidatus Levyibacteriota bacterium]